jgi:GntR family transcriptional regulator/MocR family aminotransferase
MRTRYRSRRQALVAALDAHLPQVSVLGIPAGTFALVSLGDSLDPAAIASAAAERGVAVQPAGDGRAALVLGYANLSEPAIERGIAFLAQAVGA